MKQERVERVRPRKTRAPEVVEEVVVEEPDAGLLSDVDELLDEIDAVLEDQSMLFEFRQRPGQ
ncbi:MAG TPA: ubiquitin-like protein Pup [Acidimicrobiia bacterium]|nr:ubiquitin-like protein Pup [Acidimicrobiia bacterium]